MRCGVSTMEQCMESSGLSPGQGRARAYGKLLDPRGHCRGHPDDQLRHRRIQATGCRFRGCRISYSAPRALILSLCSFAVWTDLALLLSETETCSPVTDMLESFGCGLSKEAHDARKGEQAASLRVAEQWVSAWKEMAKKSNTLIAAWVTWEGWGGVVARRTWRFPGNYAG